MRNNFVRIVVFKSCPYCGVNSLSTIGNTQSVITPSVLPVVGAASWKDYVVLLRVHQYLKNLFIFLPLFFSLNLAKTGLIFEACVAFVGFSLCASGIYIFNDIRDIPEDRQHPVKRTRPLASGVVPVGLALGLAGLLILAGFGTMIWLTPPLTSVILGCYVLMNIGYSLGLKHMPILDITMIAIGFVLRVFAGAFAISVTPSMWIILMTFLLALFLASAKRREDILLASLGHKTRKNIDGYNLEFVNAIMLIMAAVTIVAYILYTVSPEVTSRFHNQYLYVTTGFVIVGILRYMQGTFVENDSGCPTRFLLKDWFLKLTVLGWLVTFMVLIYW